MALDAVKTVRIQEFAKRKAELPEWREFKAKWDGNTPRKNSKAFEEYRADAIRAEMAIQALASDLYEAQRVNFVERCSWGVSR